MAISDVDWQSGEAMSRLRIAIVVVLLLWLFVDCDHLDFMAVAAQLKWAANVKV